jgi:hypothetical protein
MADQPQRPRLPPQPPLDRPAALVCPGCKTRFCPGATGAPCFKSGKKAPVLT